MTEARPFVIGIDPGNDGGIAVLTVGHHPALLYAADAKTGHIAAGPQLVIAVCRAVAAAEGLAPGIYDPNDDLARAIATREGGARPLLAAVEGQFLGINPHSAIELAHSAGQWLEAALNVGILSELVAPSTWQAAELSGGRRWRSAQLEAAARDKVGSLWPKLAEGLAPGIYDPNDDLARAIATREGGARPLLAAVEGQFLGINPHSAIELAHSAGQWLEAALNVGILSELVAPSTWQAAELSGGRRWRSAQLEAAARDKVGSLWPKLADRAPHVHAAVLIARWAAVRAFWGTAAARGPKATRPRTLRPVRRP